MLKDFKKHNLKRVNVVNQRASWKNKLRRQISRVKKMSKNYKLLKKRIIYMFLEKFKYILVYLDVCYVILMTGSLIICNYVTFSPFLLFSQNSIF